MKNTYMLLNLKPAKVYTGNDLTKIERKIPRVIREAGALHVGYQKIKRK